MIALILTLVLILATPNVVSVSRVASLPTSPTPSASLTPSASTPTLTPRTSAVLKPTEPWGQLIKTGEVTYRINVQNDPVMTSPDEALTALNDLRRRNSAQPLKTDPRICAYAQSRAEYFNSIGTIDSHKGFQDFLDNQDGFRKLGFQRVGENSSYGYKLTGVHLIEFVYMQSPTHNQNQLNPDWDTGCVGVSGTATNFIFATSPF